MSVHTYEIAAITRDANNNIVRTVVEVFEGTLQETLAVAERVCCLSDVRWVNDYEEVHSVQFPNGTAVCICYANYKRCY